MEVKAYDKKIRVDEQKELKTCAGRSCIRPNTRFGIYPKKKSKLTIPLKDIKFQVNIKDCLSEVEMLQIYANSNEKAVECEYLFPIDPLTTAVTGLTVTVDDKVIEATVLEKEKAKEKYSDAMARGSTAFKMNQDEYQPDIIRIAIGNLLPATEAIIVTRYVKLMQIENGCWSFRIPLAYTPRYNSRIPAHSSGGLDPKFVEKNELPYKWHLDVEINSSKPITRLASPTHKLDIEFGNSNRKAHVNLVNNNEVSNTDLIILYKTENFNTPSAILQKVPEYDCYAALISFCPGFGEGANEDVEINGSGEYIFVLDCSGSMSGGRIKLAKTALEMFLRSLPVDSKFNIVCFGSNYKFFKKGTIKYTPENLGKALSYLKKIDANMGGTEIDLALRAIFSIHIDPFYPRSLFLLTDGDVTNPDDVIDLIKKNAYNTRVHAFGIGSGASRYLVKNCALAGKGDFQFGIEGEDLTPKVIASLRKATLAACTNAKLIWPSGINIELQNTPKDNISNVYLNEPFVLLALLKGEVEGKKVELEYKETVKHKEIKLEAVLPDKAITGKDVYQAVVKDAFEKNTELQKKEIIDLSVKYSVLSKETAFIAIQKNKGKAGGPMESIKIPIAIAKDSGAQDIEDNKASSDSSLDSDDYPSKKEERASDSDSYSSDSDDGSPQPKDRFRSRSRRKGYPGRGSAESDSDSSSDGKVVKRPERKGKGTAKRDSAKRHSDSSSDEKVVKGSKLMKKKGAKRSDNSSSDKEPAERSKPVECGVPIMFERLKCTAAKRSKEYDKTTLSFGAPDMKARKTTASAKEAVCKAPSISYMEVVGEQELYGNWKWDKTTLSVIGVAEDKAQSNIPEELKVQFNDVKTLREVWITILALVKLEIDYASSKESWQLVFKKAVEWLKNSGINYAEYKQAAEKVIH